MEIHSSRFDNRTVYLLVILTSIEMFINGLSAIFNRATTFCITDVLICKSSRIIQIMTLVVCVIKIGGYIWGYEQSLQISLPIINTLIQIGLIVYIFALDDSCLFLFLSTIVAIGCSLITLILNVFQTSYIISFIHKYRMRRDAPTTN